MIALDADFVGAFAPPSKLSLPGGVVPTVPFARLPRVERLRVSGKLDEADGDDGADGAEAENDGEGEATTNGKLSVEKKEKLKMRGKGKSMKRYVFLRFSGVAPALRVEALMLKKTDTPF